MENYSFLLLLFFVVLAFGVLASILRSFNEDRQDRNRYRTDATNPYGEQQPNQHYQGPPIIINTVPFQQYPHQYPQHRPFMSPVLLFLLVIGGGYYYFSSKNGQVITEPHTEATPRVNSQPAQMIDQYIAPNSSPVQQTYTVAAPEVVKKQKAQAGIHDWVQLGIFEDTDEALNAYQKAREILPELSDYSFRRSLTGTGKYMVFIKTASLQESNTVLRILLRHEKELNSYFNNTPPEIMHI